MSKFDKFTIPGNRAQPAPVAPPSPFPTPWVVGPFGDIWVAADVVADPEARNGWRSLVDHPRAVVRQDAWEPGVASRIVEAVNAAGAGSLKPPY